MSKNKKAALVTIAPYSKGEIFNPKSYLNTDNVLVFFHELQKVFRENGIDLNTSDINSVEESDFVIYNEMPETSLKNVDPQKSFLLIFESELIRPDNWNTSSHKRFKKIFTWHDPLIDNKTYHKMNFSVPKHIPSENLAQKKKLCTLIAGNKKVKHPLELYSKRREVIDWFEKYHSVDFDFYGRGWEKRTDTLDRGFFSRATNRLLSHLGVGVKKWRCYKGSVKEKLPTLAAYKFCICYENGRDIEGYVTEKIFDCFFAGTVPVYWGASNITKIIPATCFIDQRKFSSHEELYSYLKNMSDDKYKEYLREAIKYLKSPAYLSFDPEQNAKNVYKAIVDS